jgi:pimeloyl-ACP methyl ester carboxylesterase
VNAATDWEARGERHQIGDHHVFVVDVPARIDAGHPPILILHGFPSCSFDWRSVLPALSEHRRVVLLDFLGFGLSDKPDRSYTMGLQADLAQALVHELRLGTVSLITHDMGDTVGGELLARALDGSLGFEVDRRVITNGSIYIEMAHLTPGQELLLALPDALIDADAHPGPAAFKEGLASTFSPAHPAGEDELEWQWQLLSHRNGHLLLPRLIRYIEERRANQARFTGAIEAHPSPLTIVWGAVDPVAIHPMAQRLAESRPDAELITLDGVGHYPMIEAPDRFAVATLAGLDPTR